MKKSLISAITIFSLFTVTTPISAQPAIKTIQLKDGSVIKGIITGIEDQVYTIDTENFGVVEIADSNILSITCAQTADTKKQSAETQLNSSKNLQMIGQVQQLQNSILSDPALMESIKNIAENEEIKAILSDSGLIKDALSFDPDKLKGNQKIQQLLDNPDFNSLINQVNQILPQQ